MGGNRSGPKAPRPHVGGTVAGASVAVVIVNYRTPQLTRRCLAALRGERGLLPGLRAVVVDGGSADGSAAELGEAVRNPDYAGWVSFLPLELNGGFGWANNQAMLTLARDADPPDYLHLLNPDTEVTAGAVGCLVEELQAHPRCAAAGSQLLTPEGQLAVSAFRFPSPGREFINAAQSERLGRLLGVEPTAVDADRSTEVDWVTGASVMLRTEALRKTGLFDDGFFLYFEEVELMHRLHAAGWTVRYVPGSRVVHAEGASTGLGASAAARPLPVYWYRSRRRYFSLTGGTAAAWGANLGWLAGDAAAIVKKMLGRSRPGASARARDLVSHGFWPRHADKLRSAPAWGDAPGRPPAWTISK